MKRNEAGKQKSQVKIVDNDELKRTESSDDLSPERQKLDDIRIISRLELPRAIIEHNQNVPHSRLEPKLLCPCFPEGPLTTDKLCSWCAYSCTFQNLESVLIELVVVSLVWTILWSFLQNSALPGSYVFGVAVVTALSYLVSAITRPFSNLVPGHAMIAVGILSRYTFLPELGKMGNSYPLVVDFTKRLAFVVFLLRAGLGTNMIHVKRFSPVTIRLIFIPLVIETTFLCVVAKYALDIPWLWSALLSILVSPTSPMNVFTTISRLRERGFSAHNEIHSVVIFSSVINNLVALCFCTSIITGVCTSNGWWGAPIALIPGQIIVGSVLGIVVGFVGIYVPSNNNAHCDIYRGLYFLTSSFFFIFMLNHDDWRGASFIAAYISPFVATTGWKHLNYYSSVVRMRNVTTLLWDWTQPFLYALIGAGIDVQYFGEKKRLIFIGVFIASTLVNFGGTLLATLKSPFSWKHRALLWLCRVPKATVEIATSTWAVVAVQVNYPSDKERLDLAYLLVDCCVLALFISGPIGGILINVVGQKVLKSDEPQDDERGEDVDDRLGTDQKVRLPSEEAKTSEVKRSERIV